MKIEFKSFVKGLKKFLGMQNHAYKRIGLAKISCFATCQQRGKTLTSLSPATVVHNSKISGT